MTKHNIYFKNINTQNKAYWLGYLYADGNIYKTLLSLNSKDKEIIQNFKNDIKKYNKITIIKRDNKIYYQLCISDINMIKNLKHYDLIARKTFIIKFPKLKSNLIRHFIRGYFDGDGCISQYKYTYNKNLIYGKVKFSSGSYKFIKQLQNMLYRKLNITRNKIFFHNNCYNIYYINGQDLKLIYKYFYLNARRYLKRKYNRFTKIYKMLGRK